MESINKDTTVGMNKDRRGQQFENVNIERTWGRFLKSRNRYKDRESLYNNNNNNSNNSQQSPLPV